MSENLKRCPECKNVLNSSNIRYNGTEPYCLLCKAPLRSYLNMIEQSDLNAISKLETEYLDSILNKGDKNVINLESDYNRIGLPFEEQKKRVIHFLNKLINSYKPVLVNGEVENFDNVDSIVSQLCKNFSIDKVSYLKKLYRIKNKCLKKHNKKVALILVPSCIGVILIGFIIFVMSLEFLVFNGTIIKYQKNAEDVVIPETYYGQTITKIGNDAFNNKKVRSVKMPNTVTEIGRRAFYNCAYLENINISTSLETINSEAFSGCVSLDEVIISEKIESLGEKVFDRCDDLNIVVNAKTPPKFSKNTFEGIDNFTINVPENSVELYKDSLSSYKENIRTSLLKIKFIVDNELYYTEKIEFGSSLKNFPEVPLKEGYIGSWEVNEVINITSDQIVNIIWKPLDNIQYQVVHKLQNLDGSYKEELIETLYGTTDEYVEPIAHRYDGFSPSIIESNRISGDGSLVLEIKYDRNTYKINFDSLGGTNVESIQLLYGQIIPELPVSLKEGYDFDCWIKDDLKEMPAKDLVLEANWIPKKDTSYVIKYYTENLDGSYKEEKVVEKKGTTDDVASIDLIEFTGFTEPSVIPNVTIKPDGSTCIDIYYSRNTYSLTYLVDGNIYEVKSYKHGEKILEIEAPQKIGYMFTGFSGLVETMPTSNLNVHATFDICKYKIIYKVDGYDYFDIEYNYDADIIEIENPKKDGYDFGGWYLNDELILKFSYNKMPNKDLIIYAKWNPRSDTKYLVNYYQEQLDETYKLVDSFEKMGITDSKVVAEDMKYVGFSKPENMPFGKIANDGSLILDVYYMRNEYKVSFHALDNICDEKYYKFGESINLNLINLNFVGYDFFGWYDDISYNNKLNYIEITDNNIIVYAYTSAKTNIYYKVVHRLEQLDGNYVEKITEEFNNGITDTRPVYNLKNFENYDDPINIFDYFIKGDGSTIVYLDYTLKERTITYYIDGVINKVDTYKIGECTMNYDFKTPIGYEFSGWNSSIPEKMGTENIEIYGTTKKIAYILQIFDLNDNNLLYEKAYNYNDLIDSNISVEKEGYIFSGYDDNIPSKMPNHDLIIHANLIPRNDINYKVEHYIEELDGTYSLYDYKILNNGITDELVIVNSLELVGFKSTNDSFSDKVLGNGSLVIKIYYTRNTYKLTYVLDEYKYNEINYKYGEEIQEISNPSKLGYTFTKWNNLPISMPANDLEIQAIFSPKTDITYKINHFIEELNGEYILYETEIKNDGVTDTLVSANYKEFIGFTRYGDIPKGIVLGDGSLELSVYYTRNSYTLKYITDYDKTEYTSKKYKYGETIISLDINNPKRLGYSFGSWINLPDNMPANDVTLNPTWNANNNTKYKICHYIETLTGTYELKYEENLEGTTDAYVTGSYMTITGFTQSSSEVKGAIKADGSLALKLYYTRNSYTLRFYSQKNSTGTWTEYITETVKYGSTISTPKKPTSSIIGYKFSTWDKEIPLTMPANNLTFYGQWSLITSENFFVRADAETITDSGKFKQVYECITLADFFDINGLINAGYKKIKVTVTLEAKEIDKGNNWILLYSSVVGETKYEIQSLEVYPGSSYSKITADFTAVSISSLSNTVVIRYGASDDGSIIHTDDDWSIRNVNVSISFSK